VYTARDQSRLEAICRFRKAGLGLKQIAQLLDGGSLQQILEQRLATVMRRWHVEFERLAPEGHQDFLESPGIAPEEIGTQRGQATLEPNKPVPFG
jgi:DNA-binding transcriptional MerR regulator